MRNTYGCDRGSPGHGGCFSSVTGSQKVFQAAQNKAVFHVLRVILWRAGLY